MITMHLKRAFCAACAVLLLTASAPAGIITAGTPIASPGMGTAAVPVILTLSPGNDNSNDPSSGNNIQVTTKAFEHNDYIDIVFTVASSGQGVGPVTEYRVFETVDNDTGIDWSGYTMQLGFLTGALFAPSSPLDGLDFDTPHGDPTPTSTAFGTVTRPNEDTLQFSGGVQSALQQNYEFRIDVPNGILSFTLRQSPIPVPEPLSFGLIGLAVVTIVCLRHRS